MRQLSILYIVTLAVFSFIIPGRAQAGTTRYVGVEQEFGLPPNKPVQDLIAAGRASGWFETFLNGKARYWHGGGSFLADGISGKLFESNTPMTSIRRGFVGQVVRAMMNDRVTTVGLAGGAELRSTHINVGVAHAAITAELAMSVLSPVYKALLRTNESRITAQPRQAWSCMVGKDVGKLGLTDRLEFRTYGSSDPDQLRAGILFLTATVQGIDRLVSEHLKHNPGSDRGAVIKTVSKQLPLLLRDDWGVINSEHSTAERMRFVSKLGTDDQIKLMKDGMDAKVETMAGTKTVGELMSTYCTFFKKEIEELATRKEVRLLDKYVTGKKRIEDPTARCFLDAKSVTKFAGAAPGKTSIARLRGAAMLFADAADHPTKPVGNIVRTSTDINWQKITFQLQDGRQTKTIAVPLKEMTTYLKLERKLGQQKVSPAAFWNKTQRWQTR